MLQNLLHKLFPSKQKIMHNLRVRKQFHAKMKNPLKMGMLVQTKEEELSYLLFLTI